MKLLGVDPGSTTGLSLIENGEVIREGEATSLSTLWSLLHQMSPDMIVVEMLISSPAINSSYPLEAIGVCRLYAQLVGVRMVFSNPSALQGKKKPEGLSPHIYSARIHALSHRFES